MVPSVYAETELASAKDNCPPEGCDLPHAKDPQAAYKSGYEHGVHDAHSDPSHWYILQPGQSFAFHTQEFNSGYIAPMCKAGLQTQMTNNPPPAYTEQVQWRDAATGKLLAALRLF